MDCHLKEREKNTINPTPRVVTFFLLAKEQNWIYCFHYAYARDYGNGLVKNILKGN